jgi:hypothetical protein
MESKDRAIFATALTDLGVVFGKQITKVLMDGYWEDLSSYSVDRVLEGMKIARRTCEFFPVPAILIRCIGQVPIPHVPAQVEPEMTPEEKRRTQLVGHFCYQRFLQARDKPGEYVDPTQQELDQYVRDHWNDPEPQRGGVTRIGRRARKSW